MNVEELRNFSSTRLQGRAGNIVAEWPRVRHVMLRAREGCRHLINIHGRRGCRRLSAQLALAAILIFTLLTGCVTPPNARKDLLAFLEPGRTTREEVLLKLGQPSGSFEQEKILTYRIGQYGEEGYFIVSPKVFYPGQSASWQNVHFSLVIVFDGQGRLRKHELVKVD